MAKGNALMNPDLQQIRIGLTDNHACSYLPHLEERVAVTLDEHMHTSDNYEVLLATDFVAVERQFISHIATVALRAKRFAFRSPRLSFPKANVEPQQG